MCVDSTNCSEIVERSLRRGSCRDSLDDTPPAAVLSGHQKKQSGASLVEAIISSMILALVLGGFLTGFTMATRSTAMSDDHMRAMHTARQAMEILTGCSYLDAKLNVGTRNLSTLGMSNSYTVVMNATYPSTKDVTATVYWKTAGRKETNSFTLCTSLTQGLH